jgi:ribosome biogenesis GTPase
VQAALAGGRLSASRLESYCRQKRELSYLARRQDKTLRLAERDKWKKIHLAMRERYKHEGRNKV